MLWKTHLRITNEVLHKLGIPKSGVEASRLREGVLAPDKWRDYPHHHGKGSTIRKYILDARRLFVEGDLANCYFCLGVALHYIQDSYTSLSSRSQHHPRWEQQVEQSYFVDDLEKLIVAAFPNREDRIIAYTDRFRSLSKRIEGKKDTLWLATLPGPGLTLGGTSVWGRPNVDLNFAFRASLMVAKSVLGPKTSAKLQTELRRVSVEHETLLRKAEVDFAERIVELIKKRDELEKRRGRNGFFQVLRSPFFALSSKVHNMWAKAKINDYEKQKHLKEVVREYEGVVERIIAPHRNWYSISIPQIDINVIDKELLSIQEASEWFEIAEKAIRNLIDREEVSCYHVKKRELVRKSELKKVLRI